MTSQPHVIGGLASLLFLVWGLGIHSVDATPSLPEITQWVQHLKGDDNRLFRWDASETTYALQKDSCNNLAEVAGLLTSDLGTEVNSELLIAAADYILLCITDNPPNREIFSQVPSIHKAVVDKLVKSDDEAVSAIGSHLVYIGVYTNAKNHQTFFDEGAVEALAEIVMDEEAVPVRKMYAAVALSNLAASYCHTPDDGTCHWEWTAQSADIQLNPNSPLVSDGTPMRKHILEIEGLVDELIELACEDPILEEYGDEAARPGYDAVAGEHDKHEEVVTWAAASALKNLALEPTAKPLVEEALHCMCVLKDSSDWLEESKAFGLLYHMRRNPDPCWVREDGLAMCIDDNFLDGGLFHCDEYEEDTEIEVCQGGVDKFSGKTAADSCCACGGGSQMEFDEHDEL